MSGAVSISNTETANIIYVASWVAIMPSKATKCYITMLYCYLKMNCKIVAIYSKNLLYSKEIAKSQHKQAPPITCYRSVKPKMLGVDNISPSFA